MTTAIDLTRLAQPFPARDVEWRVQSCGERNGRVWAKVLAYITNRAIMDRLDSVCGPGGWRNEFREWTAGGQAGVLCGLSIRVGDEWVTKWDGAENTDIEAVKGGLSSAMKRAAVQWGIGRYLYDLEEGWAEVVEKGMHYAKTKEGKSFQWNPPRLPDWALPRGTPPAVEHDPANNGADPGQKDRRQAHPQPPPTQYATPEQLAIITRLRDELALPNEEWVDLFRSRSVKRLTHLKPDQAEEIALTLARELVADLLGKHRLQLADVYNEAPSVSDLTHEEADAVLAMLRERPQVGVAS